MKRLLVAMSFFLTACYGGSDAEDRENPAIMRKIRVSKPRWQGIKNDTYKGAYSYTVRQNSADKEHMINWLTTVYVKDDKVRCRYFIEVDDLSVTLWLESERDGTLGKHANGAPPKLLEALYNDCYWKAMHDDKNQLLYAEDENGILKSCYVPEDAYPLYGQIKVSDIDGSDCSLNKLWKN
jgi:hypothetical protein